MSSCSSATSATAQPSVQQLIQKATSGTPKQSSVTPNDKPSDQDALNTSGSRGTKLNVSS